MDYVRHLNFKHNYFLPHVVLTMINKKIKINFTHHPPSTIFLITINSSIDCSCSVHMGGFKDYIFLQHIKIDEIA